jgi:hypothetical protein
MEEREFLETVLMILASLTHSLARLEAAIRGRPAAPAWQRTRVGEHRLRQRT